MSTKAVIARQTGDGWEGVYQHSDGYPTGLGKELWSCLYDVYDGNLLVFVEGVIDSHPAGWSHFAPEVPPRLWKSYEQSGFSSEFFAAHAVRECYCHLPLGAERDGSSAASGWVTYDPGSDGADDFEWAYCFGAGSLTIFAALPSDVRRIGDAYQVASGDVYECRPFAWQVVGIYSLRGEEPDWRVIECGRNFERCHHYAWAHLEGSERLKVQSDPVLRRLSMRAYAELKQRGR
jgi:hypothetical protein